MYFCKFLILTVKLFVVIVFQNLALIKIGLTDLPQGAFEFGTLLSFAGYSFITSMPVVSFMVFISSCSPNMWVPLGIGVAGFLSGMALATSDNILLCMHPFVVMLKPAVAMSAWAALPVSRYALSAAKFCVLLFYLFMEMVVFFVVFVMTGLIATRGTGITEALPVMYLLNRCAGFHLFPFLPCAILIFILVLTVAITRFGKKEMR